MGYSLVYQELFGWVWLEGRCRKKQKNWIIWHIWPMSSDLINVTRCHYVITLNDFEKEMTSKNLGNCTQTINNCVLTQYFNYATWHHEVLVNMKINGLNSVKAQTWNEWGNHRTGLWSCLILLCHPFSLKLWNVAEWMYSPANIRSSSAKRAWSHARLMSGAVGWSFRHVEFKICCKSPSKIEISPCVQMYVFLWVQQLYWTSCVISAAIMDIVIIFHLLKGFHYSTFLIWLIWLLKLC